MNVEYRMARVAEAPAAVEDALCALRYVVNNAKNNNMDPNKIVVSGESAGGHLALAVGMMPSTSGLTAICAGGGFNYLCMRRRYGGDQKQQGNDDQEAFRFHICSARRTC